MSFFGLGPKIEKVIGKEQELLDSSRNGNIDAVEKLLANRSKKSTTGGAFGQKLTSFLKNVNVNYTDRNGYTALHHAAVNGHRDVVEALLRADAQPGLVDNQGCTPVHLAAWNGNAEIVMQLLNAGTTNQESENSAACVQPVNVNHQNGNGDTALHCAAQYGNVPVVDVLLQKNANPTIRNLNEESALDLAAQYGRLEVVQLLLIAFPELSERPACTQSPLHLASRNGHKDIVDVLLANNFAVQTVTESGSALHEAALHGKLDVVKALLERGIDINLCDKDGRTALQLLSDHQAQQKSFTEITQTIRDYMMRSDGIRTDSEMYDRLSCFAPGSSDKPMATVRPLTPDKPAVTDKPATPDKPSPSPRLSRYSPTPPPPEDTPPTPPYSKPNKDKSNFPDRVASTTSSIGDGGPPPLPPRISVYPQEDKGPVTVTPTKDNESPAKEDSPGTTPKSMVVPKKPPRNKKSPVPVKRATIIKALESPNTSSVSPQSSTNIQSSPQPSAIAESQNFKESVSSTNIPEESNNIPIASVDSSNSSKPSTLLIDQSEEKDETTNNPVGEMDQSQDKDSSHDSVGMCDQSGLSTSVSSLPDSKHSTGKPPVSPKPSLHHRSSAVSVVKDDSKPPQMDQQVDQTDYVEMKPKPRPVTSTDNETKPVVTSSIKTDTDLKPVNVKVDNYGILFPNLRNSVPIKSKPPKITRSNTAPEENVYVGPSSAAEKLKEKHGVLRRNNTDPNEQTYVPMTGPSDSTDQDPGNENEYAEIPEKYGSPKSPRSMEENVYATIPEVKRDVESSVKMDSDQKGSQGTELLGSKKDDPLQKKIADDQNVVPKLPSRNGSDFKGTVKPTLLDFVKKQTSGPLTPTGYPQPPTPDFPPPSPATAMMGIEQKIQEMDCKRKSRDMTTITDDLLEQIQEQSQQKGQEVKVTPSIFRSELNIPSDRLSREVIKEEGAGDCVQLSTEPGTNLSDNSTVKQEVDKVSEISVDQSDKTDKTEIKTNPESSIPDCPTVIEDSSTNMADKMADNLSANQKEEEKGNLTVSIEGAPAGSPVMMRRKSSVTTPDMDVFKGLLRGSTIGGSRPKGLSLVYDEVKGQSDGRQSIPSSFLTIDSLMEEDGINVDQVMKSIDKEVAKRASNHESGGFDDSEEWAQIADIMSSFGGDLTASFQYAASEEERINSDLEAYMDKLLCEPDRGSMQSVGEWLESLGLGQYENTFIANGYDNVDFLDNKILEEQDLEQIGVLNHEHRRQILFAARSLPQLKPIDSTNPPGSMEEWLMSLQLIEYLDTFKSHGYDTMEKVESILWELQLRTVLDISQLGHRKRILASLGERHPPDRQSNSLKKKSVLSTEATKQPFSDINLFRDYTNVKPTSSSEEDVKEVTQMAVDSSEEENQPITKKKTGQSIRNSNIHLRPPHMAQTTSPARQWRHKPEMLIKGCCNYTAQYLGSTIVPDLTGGTGSTRAGITKLKRRFMQQLQKSTDVLAKIPVIMLSISFKGVKFIDAKSKRVICDHDIGNIFCACQDTENLNFFAYITRDIETGKHYCHVFSVKSSSLAHDIILTLGESFEVAYQMAMKEKSMKEAMELDRKMSQSDHEDVYSQSTKVSTNTL